MRIEIFYANTIFYANIYVQTNEPFAKIIIEEAHVQRRGGICYDLTACSLAVWNIIF